MTYNQVFIRLCVPLIATMGAVTWLQAGCSFDTGGIAAGGPDADPNADAPVAPDVPPDDPCLDWTYTPTHFDPCAIVDPDEPNGDLILTVPGEYNYDTDFGTLRDPQNNLIAHAREVFMDSEPNIRLISVDNFTLGPDSTLRGIGSLPLVIASWSTITVNGTIDVSSSLQNGQGAGANSGTCNAAMEGADATGGGGGGGGGAFGEDGGNGGDGGGRNAPPETRGTKIGAPPTNVRGGCPGASGGQNTDEMDGSGPGGPGGGALQLTAAQSITINGKLHAGGQGGRGASGDIPGNDMSEKSGGGGGGSGGMLGLEAPTIEIGANAILAANGGAGGGGCDKGLAGSGEDGQLSDAKANKGGKDGNGGDGGDGGYTNNQALPGQNSDSGGGGGGGGVGYNIMSTTPTITGSPIFSPAFVTP